MRKIDDILVEAKTVLNRARASLGHDLGGYSVRDLLLDQIPVPSKQIDEVLRILAKERPNDSGLAKYKNPAKLKRCVRKVKARNKVARRRGRKVAKKPYAVCKAAIKNPQKWAVGIRRGKGAVMWWTGKSFSDVLPVHFYKTKKRAVSSARTLIALNRKLDDYKVFVQSDLSPAKKTRLNPEGLDAAAKKLEDFTGHPATHVERVRSRSRQKTGLVLGPLKAVEYIATRDGSTDIWRHPFRKSSRPLLAVSTDGKQLHVVGGRYEFTEAGIEDR